MDHTHILLATLGGQPQIVTFTLDLLFAKGFPISDVIVMHPHASHERLQRSLAHLRDEFAGDYYTAAGRNIHFRSHQLHFDGTPIDDIRDDVHADATLDTIHHLIGELKRQGHRIHLSVTGGRRLMALLSIPVAALNFDRHDHIWHLYTPQAVKDQADEGKIMHVPIDSGVQLIRGQFLALGAYIYHPSSSFHMAQAQQRSQIDAQERARCTEVISTASPAQVKVLQTFSRGYDAQQVATLLNIKPATVHTHKTVLLTLCRNAWGLEDDKHLDYHFLQAKFAGYFDPAEDSVTGLGAQDIPTNDEILHKK
jgi:CRISPR-associated protein Csx14